MQTLITTLILLGLGILILWFFTGFRIHIKENKYLEEKDYYLQYFSPFTRELHQIFLFTL